MTDMRRGKNRMRGREEGMKVVEEGDVIVQ